MDLGLSTLLLAGIGDYRPVIPDNQQEPDGVKLPG